MLCFPTCIVTLGVVVNFAVYSFMTPVMRGKLRCILFHDTSDAQHSLPVNSSLVSHGIRHCYVSSCFGTKTITRFSEETTLHNQWVVVVLTAT